MEEILKNCLAEEKMKKLNKEKDEMKNNTKEESKEDKLPSGYFLTINDKIVFTKDGNARENVLTIEEVKQIRNLLKAVLNAIYPNNFEMGIDYIKTNKIICRFVHTDMVNNIDKDVLINSFKKPNLDDINKQMKMVMSTSELIPKTAEEFKKFCENMAAVPLFPNSFNPYHMPI